MIEILDFQQITASSSNRQELKSLLRQLLGQPFLFFRVSYGDELTIHLGETLEYAHIRMKGKRKGSYIVSARASSWFFRPNTQPLMFVGSDELSTDLASHAELVAMSEIETRSLVAAGSVVSLVEVLPTPGGFALQLILSDRSTLLIIPSPGESIEEDPVADWEVFTPHHRYLRVGPGLHWSYLASDQPQT